MTKQEAIEQMKAGQKVTWKHFTADEWVSSNPNGTIYFLDDGVECSSYEFWRWRMEESYNDGWELFSK